MKAKRIISNKEHKLLLVAAFAAFIFSIVGYVGYVTKAEYEREAYFRLQAEKEARNEIVFAGPYCYPDKHPGFLVSIVLLLGAAFFSLCFAKWYLLSSYLTVASFSRFVDWFFDTRKLLSVSERQPAEALDNIFYNAGEVDLTVCLLVSILLFWQISILLRMLIKTMQRKSVLP